MGKVSIQREGFHFTRNEGIPYQAVDRIKNAGMSP